MMSNAEKIRRILMMGLTPPLEGGSERHIYELSSRLKCDVLTQEGSVCKKKIELPILRNPAVIRNFSFLFSCFIFSIGLLLSRKKYELIHIHENLLYFLAPLLKWRYKVVITVHGIKGFKFYDKKILRFFFFKALKFADTIIAVNLEDQRELGKYFKHVEYLPNGVDLTPYNKISVKVDNKISFIGRIHPQKGIIYLLEAFNILSKKYPSLKLEIIGDINDYAAELTKKFPDRNIIWRGYLGDRNEIVRSLKSSYCIVLPSLWEGLPLTLFEALASGRPLALSDIPAFKSVIKDEALFFKGRSASDLARKVEFLLIHKNLANKIGKMGKKKSLRFEWKEITENLRKIYGL